MNMDTLSIAKFGDLDALADFLFENATQHKLFQEVLMDSGYAMPIFPLADASPDNLDDWLLAHQVEHQAFAAALDLENPFNLIDSDWNKEDDFYDWLSIHTLIHEQIVSALGL